MTRTCKCVICCGCLFVVLVVAILVGVFVIAPKIGQAAIDMTSFHIINNTMWNISGGDPVNTTYLQGLVDGIVNIHSPIFLGAKLHDVNVTMILNCPGDGHPDFTNGPIGWFTMPGTTITQGDNMQKYSTTLALDAQADNGFRFSTFAFYVGLSSVAYIDLVAEPTITAMGFITIKTKMIKTIKCNCIPGSNWCAEKDGAFEEPSKPWNRSTEYYTVDPHFNMTTGPYDDVLPPVELYCEPMDGKNVTTWTPFGLWTTTPAPTAASRLV